MATKMYIITAKTHIHAGSGNSNAGVIDNLVQRDPADNLPCIYSSSLKGAFREYFEEGNIKDKSLADKIFGSGVNKNNTGDNKKGSHIFHQASLLSIPVRSNVKPFFNAICPWVLNKFIDDAELFDISIKCIKEEIESIINAFNDDEQPLVIGNEISVLNIEDYSSFKFIDKAIPNVKRIFGENLVLFSDEDFSDLCSDYNLPVIARNNLENGQSKNLWYEQIVPRQSRFYFFTVSDCQPDNFDSNVNCKTVQIGANASIGYGVCFIENLQNKIS
jgi:CRISPR-associated protein Cmr4